MYTTRKTAPNSMADLKGEGWMYLVVFTVVSYYFSSEVVCGGG